MTAGDCPGVPLREGLVSVRACCKCGGIHLLLLLIFILVDLAAAAAASSASDDT